MENVLPKLQKLFLKKKLEIREKKTVIAVYYENLQLFSISNVRYNKELEDVTCTFTFNILKQNKNYFHGNAAVCRSSPYRYFEFSASDCKGFY